VVEEFLFAETYVVGAADHSTEQEVPAYAVDVGPGARALEVSLTWTGADRQCRRPSDRGWRVGALLVAGQDLRYEILARVHGG
jgi:hypothetical protein